MVAEAAKLPKPAKSAPLDGDLIRRRWRSLIGRHPSKTLSHGLMKRILAWREQVAEVGDISPRSRALLAAAPGGKEGAAAQGGPVEGSGSAGGHDLRRRSPPATIRVGTVLLREHAGVLHRVAVVAEGFAWEGRTYASVSAVARAITSVRWNGRRFFALDRGARRQVLRKTSEPVAGLGVGSGKPPEASPAQVTRETAIGASAKAGGRLHGSDP